MRQPVGRQQAVDVPSSNEDFALYGAASVLEGRVYTERYPKEVSEHTISFWGRSWPGLQAGFFRFGIRPGGIPPETTPIEDLWRERKRAVAACLERSPGRWGEACLQFLDRQTPDDILQIIGRPAV
jgi:hypothetical protein